MAVNVQLGGREERINSNEPTVVNGDFAMEQVEQTAQGGAGEGESQLVIFEQALDVQVLSRDEAVAFHNEAGQFVQESSRLTNAAASRTLRPYRLVYLCWPAEGGVGRIDPDDP